MSQPARSTTLDPMNLHRRTWFDGRFTLRLLATVLALAGLISSGALAANGERSESEVNSLLQTTAEPFARVTVVVHSCPDDTTASGYYQYAVRCDSETKRYGVPLGLTNSGQTTFQYSQPDSNAALEWRPQLDAGGATTIAEVVSERLREPVVFCTVTPFGNGISNAPPTYDGREMRVNAGKMSLDLKFGDELYCQWYRFPGGVVAGDSVGDDNGNAAGDDGADGNANGDGNQLAGADAGASGSAPASASAAPSDDDDASASPAGTAIGISAWTCHPGPGRDVFGSAEGPEATTIALQYDVPSERGSDYLPFPLPFRDDPVRDSRALMSVCQQSQGFDVTVSGDDAPDDATRSISGPGYTGWDSLAAGSYTVTEDDPSAVSDILVYCQRTIAGTQNIRADIS